MITDKFVFQKVNAYRKQAMNGGNNILPSVINFSAKVVGQNWHPFTRGLFIVGQVICRLLITNTLLPRQVDSRRLIHRNREISLGLLKADTHTHSLSLYQSLPQTACPCYLERTVIGLRASQFPWMSGTTKYPVAGMSLSHFDLSKPLTSSLQPRLLRWACGF